MPSPLPRSIAVDRTRTDPTGTICSPGAIVGMGRMLESASSCRLRCTGNTYPGDLPYAREAASGDCRLHSSSSRSRPSTRFGDRFEAKCNASGRQPKVDDYLGRFCDWCVANCAASWRPWPPSTASRRPVCPSRLFIERPSVSAGLMGRRARSGWFLDRFPPQARPKTGEDFAQELYRQGKLTKFQAQADLPGEDQRAGDGQLRGARQDRQGRHGPGLQGPAPADGAGGGPEDAARPRPPSRPSGQAVPARGRGGGQAHAPEHRHRLRRRRGRGRALPGDGVRRGQGSRGAGPRAGPLAVSPRPSTTSSRRPGAWSTPTTRA